jgi:pimeloyl-ACP methyl ester carboxylesterase
VIDALLGDPLFGPRIATDARGPRVAVIGHSAGGYTALALVGARPDIALRSFERDMVARAGEKVRASFDAARHLHSPAVLVDATEIAGVDASLVGTVLATARDRGIGAAAGSGLAAAFADVGVSAKRCSASARTRRAWT